MPEVQIIGSRVLTSAAVAAASAAAVARDAALSAQAAAEAAAAAAAGASDAGVAALVGSGPLTSAALSSTYAALPKIADLAAPVVMAHRSGALYAPEGTMAANRVAAALPSVDILDVGDLRTTADGAVVIFHDATLDNLTTLSGSVSDFTLASLLRTNIIDASAWYGGGWPDQPMPTLAQVIAEFGGKYRISIEPKDEPASIKLGEVLADTGIGPSVLVVAGAASYLPPSLDAGAEGCVFRTAAQVAAEDTAAEIALYQSLGIGHVALEHGTTMAKVDQYIASGLHVHIYGVYEHREVAAYAGKAIYGWHCDDPAYTPNAASPAYRRTTPSWVKSGTYGVGHFNYTHASRQDNRGIFVGTAGAYRWQSNRDDCYILLGELCPLASPTAYTVTVPITFDALGSDLNKWAGFAFGQATDLPYFNAQVAADRDCYNVILRANGDMGLYKVTDGNAAQIGTTSVMPDLTAGATVTLTITVTPTQVTVTRNDGGASITVADATWRGAYLFAGQSGYSAGLRASFGAITVA